MRGLHFTALFCFPALALAAEPVRVTFDDADARMRSAYSLAQETNNANLVERFLEVRDAVRKAFARKDLAAAERLIRDAEELVGLDPGGKTMLGLPVARLGPDQRKPFDALRARLATAMRKEDRVAVSAAVGEIAKLLGNLAGVPELRRHGDDSGPSPVKPADVADQFSRAIDANPRLRKALEAGVPGPESLPRSYASVALGCVIMRPIVQEYRKEELVALDRLVRGCCTAILALQLDAGCFKFPDLRGKHLLYGEAIEKITEQNPEAVRDGWVVVPDTEGGSQVDAAECGIVLLRAGAEYKNPDWTRAGRKAADWSLAQPAVPTFHFNAYSVSLACEAYRVTGDKAYLDGARKKYEVGIAAGQLTRGRWVDPLSARTDFHFVQLRALQDLEEALPAGKDRERVSASARLAVKALLEEADKLGAPVTPHTIQELSRHLTLHADADPKLRSLLEKAVSGTLRRANLGGLSGGTLSLSELAAANRVGRK